MGVPCITHVSEWFRARLPGPPPLMDATPDTITDVLRAAIAEAHRGPIVDGDATRAYVERWHDSRKVAATLLGIYGRETHEEGVHECW